MATNIGKHKQTILKSASIGSRMRALALVVIAIAAAVTLWQMRPSTPPRVSGTPDSGIVAGCAWLAWLLAGYLCVAVAAAALPHLTPRTRRAWTKRLAPRLLHRAVEVVLTIGVTASAVGTGVASATPVAHHVTVIQTVRGAGPSADGSALDWPGLAVTHKPAIHKPEPHKPEPLHPVPHHRASPPAPPIGLVAGSHGVPAETGHEVIVHRGDSLWSIAARELGPGASDAAISTAWHHWYAANRFVIGADPSLIHPGQRLHRPSGITASDNHSRRTR